MASDFETLLNQVKNTVDSAIDCTSVIRKRFAIHENDRSFPLVIITPLAEHEDSEFDGSDTFELGLCVAYPVLVAIVLNEGNTLSIQNDMMELREDTRRALRSVKVPNIPNVSCYNVEISLDPPFDRATLSDNLDASAMILTYKVQEIRNV